MEALIWFGERRWDVVENRLKERAHVLLLVTKVQHHITVAARTVDDRGIELFFGSIELHQQLEDFVVHLGWLSVFAVNFIDDEHDFEAVGESFAEHEAGLGLGTVIGVDQEEYAIDHAEGAFDFAAEVSVAGGVDDVDGLILPVNGSVFGLNGDALLFLEVHGVHGAFFHALIGAVNAAFLEQFVDQRSFAVVNVGDNSDIADVLIHFCGGVGKLRNRQKCKPVSRLARRNLGGFFEAIYRRRKSLK